MPWVTEHLTPSQLADLPKQIKACIAAAIREARREAYEECKMVVECEAARLFNESVSGEHGWKVSEWFKAKSEAVKSVSDLIAIRIASEASQ